MRVRHYGTIRAELRNEGEGTDTRVLFRLTRHTFTDRTKPSPSPGTHDKITDKNLHTISRCLTIPLSILYPTVECLIHLRARSQVWHLTRIYAAPIEMLYLTSIDLLRVKSENIEFHFRRGLDGIYVKFNLL